MRERDQQEFEEYFPYRRLSQSALVAVVSAIFAIFVLGGLVKTYLQLDATRTELAQMRRENEALKDAVRRTRARSRPAYASAPEYYERVRPLPSAPRDFEQSLPGLRGPLREIDAGRSPQRSALAVRRPPPYVEPPTRILPEDAAVSLPVYGPASRNSGEGPAEGGRKIVAVDYARKQLVVDGGRNVGVREGELLAVYRGRELLADLRVTEVYESMARCEFRHYAVEPVPGDLVRAAPASPETSGLF